MIVAEFRRQNEKHDELANDLTLADDDSHASRVIFEESRKAHAALVGNTKRRIRVVGSERHDVDGRQGTIRHWDAGQGRFCVGLDTKKSSDCDVKFVEPEALEAILTPRSPVKNSVGRYVVDIEDIFDRGDGGIGCQFTLEIDHVTALRRAESIEEGLEAFRIERDEMDDRMRVKREEEMREEEDYHRLEEEYRRQEEIDRRRRAERKAKERAERERDFMATRVAREEACRMTMGRIEKLHKEKYFKGLLDQMLRLGIFECREQVNEFLDLIRKKGFKFEGMHDFMEVVNDFLRSRYDDQRLEERNEQDRKMAEVLGEIIRHYSR